MKGSFIVLEGIDGSGTTTQVERLGQTLRTRGHEVVTTFEPTGRAIGSMIRSALQRRLTLPDGTPAQLDWKSLALLFAADRTDHVERVIEPALERGAIVLSDRYYLSSLAYQSATSPEGDAALPWLRSINERARPPDLTLVLDLPAEVAAERRGKRGGVQEIFEVDALQVRLADLYRRARELVEGDRIVLVDGHGTADDVHDRLLESLGRELGL